MISLPAFISKPHETAMVAFSLKNITIQEGKFL